MKRIGEFTSPHWGLVTIYTSHYDSPLGPLAVLLTVDTAPPLTTLSVYITKPLCSQDSADLPPDCFYVKDWAGNKTIARECEALPFFKRRPDLPTAKSGYVTADVWQLVEPA